MGIYGRITKTSLADLDWTKDWNCEQPCRAGARFGLELAQLAYDFQTEPWVNAGWTDIAIQVDRRLLTGIQAVDEDGDWRQMLLNNFLPKLAKRLTVLSNPITQLRGLRDESLLYDTGKAITMIKPMQDGRFAVAIGFTGTGQRPQDWVSNTRFLHPDKIHAGFESLCELYESNADDIVFPTAARLLGMERLTLEEVLLECRQDDSRFTLIMAGHSQGAAVLQVWAHRRMVEGLKAQHIKGMGFASPMVAAGMTAEEQACPLTLFVSNDDIFTRTGLSQHLGCVWAFDPDEKFRALIYSEAWGDPLFHEILDMISKVKNIDEALVTVLGFLEAMETVPRKEAGAALGTFINTMKADRWLPMAEDAVGKMLRFLRMSVRRYYHDLTGESTPVDQIKEASIQVQRLLVRYKAQELTAMFYKTITLTHFLAGKSLGREDLAPYSYMVVRGFDRLYLQKS